MELISALSLDAHMDLLRSRHIPSLRAISASVFGGAQNHEDEGFSCTERTVAMVRSVQEEARDKCVWK
jgi:hypothetical protein